MSISAPTSVPSARITTTSIRMVGTSRLTHLRASASATGKSMGRIPRGRGALTTGRASGRFLEIDFFNGTRVRRGWIDSADTATFTPSRDADRAGQARTARALSLLSFPHAKSAKVKTLAKYATIRLTGAHHDGYVQIAHESSVGWIQFEQVWSVSTAIRGLRVMKNATTLWSEKGGDGKKLRTMRPGEDVHLTGVILGQRVKAVRGDLTGWIPVSAIEPIKPSSDPNQAGSAQTATAVTLMALPNSRQDERIKAPAGATLWLSGRSYRNYLEVSYEKTAGWILSTQVAPTTTAAGLRYSTQDQKLLASPSSGASARASLAKGQDLYFTGRYYAKWREVKTGKLTGWAHVDKIASMATPETVASQVGSVAVKTRTTIHDQPIDLAPVKKTIDAATIVHSYGRSRNGWDQVWSETLSGWVRSAVIIPATKDAWVGVRTTKEPVTIFTEHRDGSSSLGQVPADADVYATGRVYGTFTEITHGAITGWALTASLASMASEVQDLQAGSATVRSALSLKHQAHTLSRTTVKVPAGATIWLSGRVRKDWVQASYDKVSGWMKAAEIAPLASSGWANARSAAQELALRSHHDATSKTLLSIPAGTDVLGTGNIVAKWTQVTHSGKTGWVPQAGLVAIAPGVDELQAGPALALSATALLAQPLEGTAVRTEVPSGATLRLTGKVHKDWVEAFYAGRTGWMPEALVGPAGSEDLSGVRRVSAETALRARHWSLSARLTTIPAGSDVVLSGQGAGSWTQVSFEGTTGWLPTSALQPLSLSSNPAAAGAGTTTAAVQALAHPVQGAAAVATLQAQTPVLLTGRSHGDRIEVAAEAGTGWVLKSAAKLTAAPTILPARPTKLATASGITTTMDELVARRFTTGAAPAVFDQVRRVGWRSWLSAQMASTAADDQLLDAQLNADLPLVNRTWKQVEAYANEREIPLFVSGVVDRRTLALSQRIGSTALRQIFTRRHLNEVMFEFWMDHFSMPYTSDIFISGLDIDVVMRREALSPFPKILATMYQNLAIYYMLDGRSNVKGRVNENLGRETLELYTLGDGHFTETDVENLSLLLTGWGGTYDGLVFTARSHHYTPAPLAIAGKLYPNATEDQARASHAQFIQDMAAHPATIRRICTKLATRFVQDSPPQALVDRLVQVYGSAGGDVKKLLWAIVDSAEFRASAGNKWKRPGEYAAGMHRALQVRWDRSQANTSTWAEFTNTVASYQAYLNIAGHKPRSWVGPDGYPDRDEYWMGSSAILQCFKMAMNCRSVDRELVAAGTWAQLLPVDQSYTAEANADHLFRVLTGYTPSLQQRQAVAQALTDTAHKWPVRVDNAARIVLTSPLAFLR